MPTIKTFLLPDLGEGLTEADLLTWEVALGDTVALNQIIAEVETAKASVELPSPYAGTVTALHAEEGATVAVGSPFIDIRTDDEPNPQPAPASGTPRSQNVATGPTTEREPVLVGYGVADETVSKRGRRTENLAGSATFTETSEAAVGSASTTGADVQTVDKPLAAPPVRFSAKNDGIDLADVTPTGVRGQVTHDDLQKYREARSAAASGTGTDHQLDAPTPRNTVDEDRTPIKGVRKHTAAAMVRSAFTAPHVTEFVDVDVTPTMELLERLRQAKTFQGVRLTPLTLVAKALLVALRSNPSVNSFWDEDAQEIVTKHYVNLGIAAATPRGLMVPNIKGANALGLKDLALALADLTKTAKDGKTGPADLADGTITITNVGVFGVDAGTPILNPGEAAILCFGSIRRRPWEFEGDIALRSVTTLSLSFDHRLVDGDQGSKFLATIADILSDPINLIALN
ncbi:2-oxo acid dehydrogenase subunit E2 [Rhodococcus fascians]|nr:2-oxo acid dehydrogenase subunit E2 [Rhodococcus fascians]MBY4139201.1 2-oxo acid dehydrogenase subunit E2 [Rhodococcus fascians]MBY4217668.1 2-oxo acid dehydrogenase subunit E2 [Rhodococcus fascians]MBY4224594.1 2-oxo acid dehydrogenase subunit E2 [Rhodococcus fascians]MBY4233744.1 2-oxo acid dehydrogenase subunit E2 [Rhodococcus fascians]